MLTALGRRRAWHCPAHPTSFRQTVAKDGPRPACEGNNAQLKLPRLSGGNCFRASSDALGGRSAAEAQGERRGDVTPPLMRGEVPASLPSRVTVLRCVPQGFLQDPKFEPRCPQRCPVINTFFLGFVSPPCSTVPTPSFALSRLSSPGNYLQPLLASGSTFGEAKLNLQLTSIIWMLPFTVLQLISMNRALV